MSSPHSAPLPKPSDDVVAGKHCPCGNGKRAGADYCYQCKKERLRDIKRDQRAEVTAAEYINFMEGNTTAITDRALKALEEQFKITREIEQRKKVVHAKIPAVMSMLSGLLATKTGTNPLAISSAQKAAARQQADAAQQQAESERQRAEHEALAHQRQRNLQAEQEALARQHQRQQAEQAALARQSSAPQSSAPAPQSSVPQSSPAARQQAARQKGVTGFRELQASERNQETSAMDVNAPQFVPQFVHYAR